MTVKRLAALLLMAAVYFGVKHYMQERVDQEQRTKMMEVMAAESAQVFGRATVKVHQAVPYTGPCHIKPDASGRTVALDIEFLNVGEGLDLDDLDIINADNDENYGSDPDMVALSPGGEQIVDEDTWPQSRQHFRGYFIYAIPKSATRVRLSYWGNDISSTTVAINDGGNLSLTPTLDQVFGNRQFGDAIIVNP